MNKYLSDIQRKLAKIAVSGFLPEDTVRVLLDLFRQHLEANGLQLQYRILMFYCNWSLHVRLDKGIVQDILDDISTVLADPSEKAPNDRINEILSLARLRSEIRQVLNSAGIKSVLFDSHQDWKAFLDLLTPALLDKPLVRTRSTSLVVYAVKVDLYEPDLSRLDPEYISACSLREGAVFWRVFAAPKDVTVTGPLVLPERPEEFSPM